MGQEIEKVVLQKKIRLVWQIKPEFNLPLQRMK